MRICSLLPSATEIVCALGLEDQLVAITHECNYPPSITAIKPVVTLPILDLDNMPSSYHIHQQITDQMHQGSSLYAVLSDVWTKTEPDLVLTQELCPVCAVSYTAVKDAVRSLNGPTQILSLEPTTIKGILNTILTVGDATGSRNEAAKLVKDLTARLSSITELTSSPLNRPRVACIEWLDPLFVGGHWIPQMVEIAGGQIGLGVKKEPSFIISWYQILMYQPEVVVFMLCGFDVRRSIWELSQIDFPPGWYDLPATKNNQIFVTDGSAYFSRPGPRILDGIDILCEILHPEHFPPSPHPDRWVQVPML